MKALFFCTFTMLCVAALAKDPFLVVTGMKGKAHFKPLGGGWQEVRPGMELSIGRLKVSPRSSVRVHYLEPDVHRCIDPGTEVFFRATMSPTYTTVHRGRISRLDVPWRVLLRRGEFDYFRMLRDGWHGQLAELVRELFGCVASRRA